MLRKRMITELLVILMLLISSRSFASGIVIKGSTTVLPITQRISGIFQKLYPDVELSVSGGGSGNGIRALIEGLADIANSSRFIKFSEVKRALSKGGLSSSI